MKSEPTVIIEFVSLFNSSLNVSYMNCLLLVCLDFPSAEKIQHKDIILIAWYKYTKTKVVIVSDFF